jgi:hypothetical protein
MKHQLIIAIAAGLSLGACASNPDKIAAAYVSPSKYQDFDCEQIGLEMQAVGERTTLLHAQLKQERNNDNAQMGVGLVLFWPALFFLEGGDGPEAAEYAQLKGDFAALQENSVQKNCTITAKSPAEIMKDARKNEQTAGSE